MSIVNLLPLDKQLVAACENGWIIVWDLQSQIDSTITDIDGIAPSLGLSKGILRMASQLIGLQQSVDKLIGFNASTIYTVLKTDIENAINKGQFFKFITTAKLSLRTEQITCLVVLDEKTLLFGTDDSCLYKYDFLGRKVSQTIKVYQEGIFGDRIKLFCPQPKQKVQLASICLSKDKQQAFIGLSNGYIYKIQVHNLNILTKLPTQLSTFTCLMPIEKQGQLISIHQDFIFSWNTISNECIAKVQVDFAKATIDFTGGIYLIVGTYPELHWANATAVHTIGITMRSSSCAKALTVGAKRYMAVGGSDGMVDVFWKNSHILVLFPSVDKVID